MSTRPPSEAVAALNPERCTLPPLLSIILPAFNSAETITRTLNSVMLIPANDQDQVELVIVDDGSTDNTMELVEKFRQSRPEIRMVTVSQANAGANVARNNAITRSTGQWLFFLDTDDELLLNPLPDILTASPETTCLHYAVELLSGQTVSRRGAIAIDSSNHMGILSSGNPFIISSLVFRRSAVSSLFDVQIRLVEDWLFWLENKTIFTNVRIIADQVLSRIHVRTGSSSRNLAAMGRSRTLVASRMLATHAKSLSKVCRNNFLIHEQIGKINAKEGFRPGVVFCLPCDPVLYVKFWMYLFARIFHIRWLIIGEQSGML